MKVLGIETSCDETGVAIYDSEHGLEAHVLYSQVEIHARYGGVFPELASRDHVRKTIPLILQMMEKANIKKQDIDGVAYTKGPGLIGALLVGASIGRSIGFALGVPTVAIHHMEAHLLAPMLEKNPPKFPFVALLISGGHTLLIYVEKFGHYKIIGETLDDAVGEAFDKTAKLLGLSYPGGPALEKLAKLGNSKRFIFPRPMVDRPGLDFSFSGIKTFAVNICHQFGDDAQVKADIACAFQEAIADTLAIKCRRALKHTGLKQLVVAGGVSANQTIKERLQKMSAKEQAFVFYPRLEFCTDNGAIVAYVGCQRLLMGQKDDLEICAKARWSMNEI